MRRFLSFDCANRSLAYTLATVDVPRLMENVADSKSSGRLVDAANILDAIIIEKMGVVDFVGCVVIKGMDTARQSVMLRGTLANIHEIDAETTVLVENQPRAITDGTSFGVQCMLCMYFAQHDVKICDPADKNLVAFSEDLCIDVFRAKHVSDRYRANKEHTKANLLRFLEVVGADHIRRGITKSCMDDAGDSFMQILGFLLKKKTDV
jgi:hypothetical protein